MTNKIGKAYAFFHCNTGYDQIKAQIPRIRSISQLPSNLELSLYEGVEGLNGEDAKLDEIIEGAKSSGMGYALKASLPRETNKKAADETVTFMNQAYQSPLYEPGEEFRGEVVYEEDGKYIFRE